MKDPLNNMKGNRLNRYGEIKPIAVIETEMAIKEPHVGMSIQSSHMLECPSKYCISQPFFG